MSERSAQDDSRSRSSTITLKKSSRSGSTSTIPRSFVGTSSNKTPEGSIRKASRISGTRPVARMEAKTSGMEYQRASCCVAQTELSAQILDTVAFIKETQQYRYRQTSIYARLYGNMPLYNFVGANF